MRFIFRLQIQSAFILSVLFSLVGCSLLATRPVQEMSDTSAALKAAHEVNADTLAPELYRQANEWFFKAKNEYKLKNFNLADEYATKARYYAEQAEFESIRNGGIRSETPISDPLADTGASIIPPPPPDAPMGGSSEPYAYPSPQGKSAESIMKDQQTPPAATGAPTAPTAPGVPPAPTR